MVPRALSGIVREFVPVLDAANVVCRSTSLRLQRRNVWNYLITSPFW